MLKKLFEFKKGGSVRNRVVMLLTVLVLIGVGIPQQGNALPFGAPVIEQNGLTWLSPIWSQSISYSDMANRLSNASSAYYGFRLATTSELIDLFCYYFPDTYSESNDLKNQLLNYGLAERVYGPVMGLFDPFFNQFGWHESGVAPDYSRILAGYSWEPITGNLMITHISESDIYGGIYTPDSYELYISVTNPSTFQIRPYVGTWLVKSAPVPEPATILLFGTGLAGLAAMGRRKRK